MCGLCGACGVGRVGGHTLWGFDPDAGPPGMCGGVGGWARLTKSSPDESDSLSVSVIWQSLNGTRIDCVNFNSFAGKRVSSNFTSQEISKCWWAASPNWYPLDPGSYPMKIIADRKSTV